MSGPARKPEALRLVEGYADKRPPRPNVDAGLTPLGKPPPAKLMPDKHARDAWRRVVQEAYWLTEADRQALTVASHLTAMVIGSAADISAVQNPKDAGGIPPDPALALKVLSVATPNAIRMLAELGLTPASRARVLGQAQTPPDEADPPGGHKFFTGPPPSP